jgi:Protein of unknown function (DUF3014)
MSRRTSRNDRGRGPGPIIDGSAPVGHAWKLPVNSDSSRVIVIGLVIAALVGGGLWWWKTHQQKIAPVAAQRAPAPTAAAPSVKPMAPPAPPPPAEPSVRHPIARVGGGEALPALDQADGLVKKLLSDLLGHHAVQTFLANDGLLRKVVATVDNLGRDHAPSEMWPVTPTPGRFAAQPAAGGSVIGAANHDRYTPFVSVATSVDASRVVAIYRRLYPLLQQAYEDLGYPGKYFNDRVVEVIDDMRATPDLAEPLRVKPVAVPGAAPGKTSLYLFEDPSIEARSAGQKVLLRMGRANAARVKAKLGEIRKLIATDFSAGLPGAK